MQATSLDLHLNLPARVQCGLGLWLTELWMRCALLAFHTPFPQYLTCLFWTPNSLGTCIPLENFLQCPASYFFLLFWDLSHFFQLLHKIPAFPYFLTAGLLVCALTCAKILGSPVSVPNPALRSAWIANFRRCTHSGVYGVKSSVTKKVVLSCVWKKVLSCVPTKKNWFNPSSAQCETQNSLTLALIIKSINVLYKSCRAPREPKQFWFLLCSMWTFKKQY